MTSSIGPNLVFTELQCLPHEMHGFDWLSSMTWDCLTHVQFVSEFPHPLNHDQGFWVWAQAVVRLLVTSVLETWSEGTSPSKDLI